MRVNRAFVFGAMLLAPCWAGAVRGEDLPPDAQKLVQNFEQDAADIQARADQLVQARRERLIASLQALRERYINAGQTADAEAVRAQIEKLQTAGVDAQADPGNLTGFRGQNDKSFYFEVTGNKNAGSVWGTDLYTDDSALAAAVVHAGVLADGQKGVVKVTILPGAASYQGSDRNGVSTGNWDAWAGSFRVERVGPKRPGEVAAQPDPGSLTGFRGQNGKAFLFEVTGNKNAGAVWGTDVYTDDSALAAAAVHAGVLTDGQKGIVKVTILPGRDAYEGSDRNGVASDSYGSWAGSYRVERVGPRKPGQTEVLPDPGNLTGFRGQNGKSFLFEVTGNKNAGSVWGTDLYTDDSALAAAVVHAGVLADGEKGVVKVTILPGADSYQGSDRNGVSTGNWDNWVGSFRIQAVKR